MWILLLAFASLQPTLAAFDNYNSVLIGSRASGMGGAFTALSGDPAAGGYYNPATTVLHSGSALAASANLYSKNDTQLGKTEELLQATQRVNRGFFKSIPSSAGTIVHFDSFALGLSIVVPDFDTYSGPIKSIGNSTAYVSVIDESLWVGGNFSARLTERDSIGLSLYYTARRFERSASDKEVNGSQVNIILEEKSLTANSIVAIFGYHRNLSENWFFGISYRLPSLPISGEASFYRSQTVTTSSTPDSVTQNSGLRARTRVPGKLAVGFAREIKGRSTIAFDMNVYESIAYNDMDSVSGYDFINHRQLINFSFGFEQPFGKDIVWRLGIFTNFSSHPSPDPSQPFRQADGVEMGGFSSNFEFATSDKTWMTVGGYYTGGRGKTLQYVNGGLTLVEKAQQNYILLVSSGFNF